MTVLGSIGTIGAAILVDVRVGFEMRVEHGLVHTGIGTFSALEGLGAEMVSQVVFQMMLVFRDEGTFWTGEHFLLADVGFGMFPKFEFCVGLEFALFAFEGFHLRNNRKYAKILKSLDAK